MFVGQVPMLLVDIHYFKALLVDMHYFKQHPS